MKLIYFGSFDFLKLFLLLQYFCPFFLSYFLGDDGIEGDIRKTKDDVLILFHDSTIKRLSDSFGYINQITFDELRN